MELHKHYRILTNAVMGTFIASFFVGVALGNFMGQAVVVEKLVEGGALKPVIINGKTNLNSEAYIAK